ncbi:MAG: hypothetical protein E7652_00335 [Ruminococcaceae bacterium]|nr:hypothetical protein [Oscillospiraceae bacterium]
MDKITFLAELSQRLTKFSLMDDEIDICVAKVREYLDTISDEEFARQNPGEADVDDMADTVYSKYIESKSAGNTDTPEADAITEDEEHDEAPEDILEVLAREAEEERRNQEKAEELKRLAIERAIAENDEIIAKNEAENEEVNELRSVFEDDGDPIIEAVDPEERPDVAFDESEALNDAVDDEFIEEEGSDFLVDTSSLKKAGEKPKRTDKRFKESEKKEKIKGTPLFWTIFVLLLPIICPVLLLGAGVFASVYVAITLLIVALCGAIVAVVTMGTIVSLVGIIYGAILAFKIAPLGMYEVGIGIIVGSLTMLLSVLMYNLAIRFSPLLYKWLTKLLKLVVKQLIMLFNKAKKECGR